MHTNTSPTMENSNPLKFPQTSEREKAQKEEKEEKAEEAEEPEKAEKAEKAEKVEKPEKAEKAEKAEQTTWQQRFKTEPSERLSNIEIDFATVLDEAMVQRLQATLQDAIIMRRQPSPTALQSSGIPLQSPPHVFRFEVSRYVDTDSSRQVGTCLQAKGKQQIRLSSITKILDTAAIPCCEFSFIARSSRYTEGRPVARKSEAYTKVKESAPQLNSPIAPPCLSPTPSAAGTAATPPTTFKSPGGPNFCSHCGNTLANKAGPVCPQCGWKLPMPSPGVRRGSSVPSSRKSGGIKHGSVTKKRLGLKKPNALQEKNNSFGHG